MTLNEKWIPSPNYSTSRGPYNKVVLHTTEGAMTIESLGSWFAQKSAQCSSHHGADNAKRGVFGAYVFENYKAWTQGNANPYCLSLEMCGYAKWSRDYWLNSQNTLLRNAADWVAYCCGKYNIPMTLLNNSQAQNPNARGICQHVNFGSWGSGHHDCGSGFPMDKVLEWAKGGSPSPQPTGSDYMSSSAFDSKGNAHFACVWTDGKLNYRPPGGSWYAIDPSATVKSGGDIAISSSDIIMVTATNNSGKVITYQKKVSDGKDKWAWTDRGGSARLCRYFTPGAERMADCKRRKFGSEWEARAWLADNPWPEPSPPVSTKRCPNCGQLHLTDKPNGNGRRRNGRKKR